MFKTSQPNPERSKNESVNKKREPLSSDNSQFETLVDFSKWLDEQLEDLESKHEEFFTSRSMRTFFELR